MTARTLAELVAVLDAPAAAAAVPPEGPVIVGVAGTPSLAAAAAGAALRRRGLDGDRPVVMTVPAADWPFTYPLVDAAAWPAESVVWIPDLHLAFENHQTNSTRLVTTQPLYLLQVWIDALRARPDVVVAASATRASLTDHAPEVEARRGPWQHVALAELPSADLAAPAIAPTPMGALPAAFRAPSPAARLEACGRALDEARTPARLLAMASVCMEVNDLDNARALLTDAVAIAPEWSAAHFELGKLWLRRDAMVEAAEAFGRASALMPSFASAAANWGATLGELDRPEEAVTAFARALESDPTNHQALNNVGVVYRELGRLAESEATFRRVIALTPGLAFGHYNLGHTLFLQGRYQAALAAYVAGQRNDPARNPVQASRLALARLATGDASGALRDLQTCTATLPAGYRRQVLEDTHAVAWALLSAGADVPGWQLVGDWLSAELAR